jgi:hypothetical protein
VRVWFCISRDTSHQAPCCVDPTTHIDNEYSRAGIQDPKIVITTSRDPSSKLLQFSKVCRNVCKPGTLLEVTIGNAIGFSQFASNKPRQLCCQRTGGGMQSQ